MAKRIFEAEILSQTLPIKERLDWEDFQLFCTDLLKTNTEFADVRDYLKQGNNQDGIDIYASPIKNTKSTVAQCKLERYISPSELNSIVEKFITGSFAANTRRFILCTSFDFKTEKAERAIAAIRTRLKESDIEFTVWDKSGLEAELRINPRPQLVARHFGEEVARAFYGEVFSEWINQYRKVEKYFYKLKEEYVDRTLSRYGDLDAQQHFIYENDRQQYSIIDFYKKPSQEEGKKIILLSTAGFGKTFEAEHLASYYADKSKMLFPIKIYLSDYEGQTINELLSLYKDWEYVPKELLLLIFDGLDEIGYNHQSKFSNHLNQFAEANPKTNIFVSSRYNAYDLTYPPLRNFEVLILNEFSKQDIDTYISKNIDKKVCEFYKKVEIGGFTGLIGNPYYLTRLVRFFKDDNGEFPKNKSPLFERILFERFDLDNSKYKTQLNRKRFKEIAQAIAFCMTAMDKKDIGQEMLDSIIPDAEERLTFSKFFLLTKNSDGRNAWSFEHKNLQEYLCASFFQQISFEKLKSQITFKYAPNILQPHYLNTISFLFDIASEELFNPLFDWLYKSQPELLIRFEKDRIDKGLRFEIVKQVLEYYGNKDLSLYSSKNFTVQELVYFVQIDSQVLDYLETKLFDVNTTDWMAYDIISFISEFTNAYVHRERIAQTIIKTLPARSKFPQLASNCIRTLIDLNFLDAATATDILNSDIDFENFEIRSATVSYLHRAELSEEYFDFIIESRDIYAKGQKEIITYGSNELFNLIITKIKKPDNIKKTLRLALNDIEFISDGHSSKKANLKNDEVGKFLVNAKEAFSSDMSIVPLVYRVFCKDRHLSYDRELSKHFKDFFKNTIGIFPVFQKLYKYSRTGGDLFLFIDENGCEFLLNEYRNGRITDLLMSQHRNRISHENRDLFLKFQSTLESEFGEKFVIEDMNVDYAQLKEEYVEKNQQMLLDRDEFFKEADLIFEAIGKEKIKSEDLWSYENRRILKFQSSLVLETFRHWCRDKEKDKQQLIGFLMNDDKWEWFKIKKIKELLKNDKSGKPIHPRLISTAENWCLSNIQTLDYSNAVTQTVENQISCNSQVLFNNELFSLLNLEIEDELLIKMLPSDFNGGLNNDLGLSGIIVSKVRDKALLKATVLDNIENGLPSWVLRTHFAICDNLGYSECLPKLYETIINNTYLSSFDKNKFTGYYFNLGGKVQDFETYFTSLPNEILYSSWRWYLIQNAADNTLEFAIPPLLQAINSIDQPDENKLEACRLLIKLERIEGLLFWKEYVLNNKNLPFDHRQEVIIQHAPQMEVSTTVPLLIEVLEFTYINNLHTTLKFPYSIEEAVYAILHAIALKNMGNLEYVLEVLTQLYQSYKGMPFARHIEFHKERISQDFYRQQIPTFNLIDVIKIYSEFQCYTQA